MEARKQYQTLDAKEVIDGRHPPVIFPMLAASNQGIIPAGCVLSKDTNGKIIPYAVLSEEEMTGTVNGSNKTFTYDASDIAPLQPGSISVAHGDVALQDNGLGVIYGSGGSGTVNYATGAISVTFTTAPAEGSDSPEADAATAVVGVALRPADTAREDVVSVVVHGTVLRSSLVIGVAAGTITQAAVDALRHLAIYATA